MSAVDAERVQMALRQMHEKGAATPEDRCQLMGAGLSPEEADGLLKSEGLQE